MRSFGSDNHSGAHPRILQALLAANTGHAAAYGQDPWTQRAETLFKQNFGDVETFFVFNGTAANVLALNALVKPHQSIFCTEVAHLTVDECGAPERFLGCKLIALPHVNGKLQVKDVQARLIRGGDQHFAQPRVISITQPTELGTVYSMDELATITAFARQHNLLVHMDGARLVNAATSLGVTLKQITTGVDALSFGGTKNGLVYGEAVILFAKNADFRFMRKQAMQLASKSRFVAAQFEALLGMWQETSQHALAMAKRLEAAVTHIPGVRITQPVQANAVFAVIPRTMMKAAREKYFFYVWDEHTGECRWMTSHDTTPEDVDGFAAALISSGQHPTTAPGIGQVVSSTNNS